MMPLRRLMTLGLPAAALAPAAASAFRLDVLAGTEAERLAACDARPLHEAMRDEIGRAFGEGPLPEEVVRALDRAARCPYCGCPVLGRADHDERASPPRG